EQGDESSAPSILNHLAMATLLAGDLVAAEAHARDGYVRAVDSAQVPTQAAILGRRALIATRRGAFAQARELARQSLVIAAGRDFDPASPLSAVARGGEAALWAMGELEMSIGNAAEAHRWL